MTVHTARYGVLAGSVGAAIPFGWNSCPESISAGTCWNMIGMSSQAVGCSGSAGTGSGVGQYGGDGSAVAATDGTDVHPLPVGRPT